MRLLLFVCTAALSATIASAAVEGTTGNVFVDVRGTLYAGRMAIGGETTGTIVRAEGIDWELDFGGDRRLARAAREFHGSEVRASGGLDVRRGVERGVRHIIRVTGLRPSRVPYSVSYTTERSEAETPIEVAVPRTRRPVTIRERDTDIDPSDFEPRGVVPERNVERPLDWWEPSETLDAPFRGPAHESILPQIEIDW